jgi:hypothetical protein
MYQYSRLLFGGTSTDVGQGRPVEARGAVSTIDLAARARWHGSCVRQRCLRCTSTYLSSFGGTSADVGQCRPVEARGAVSTSDHAARALWRRRRVRQGCLRCTSTCCCHSAGRAQMSDKVDPSRRAVQCRPSISPPVHSGTAVVCFNVAYDVPVLAVVIRRDERRCRTMSTRRGALCSVDHRPRCSCTVAPPPCAPRLPMMYQCSLSSSGGMSADVGQCRLVEARSGLPTIDLAARARWRRRRMRQGRI